MVFKKNTVILICIAFILLIVFNEEFIVDDKTYEAGTILSVGHIGAAFAQNRGTVIRNTLIEETKSVVFYVDSKYEDVDAYDAKGHGKLVAIKSYCKVKSKCVSILEKVVNDLKLRHKVKLSSYRNVLKNNLKFYLELMGKYNKINIDNIKDESIRSAVQSAKLDAEKMVFNLTSHAELYENTTSSNINVKERFVRKINPIAIGLFLFICLLVFLINNIIGLKNDK